MMPVIRVGRVLSGPVLLVRSATADHHDEATSPMFPAVFIVDITVTRTRKVRR